MSERTTALLASQQILNKYMQSVTQQGFSELHNNGHLTQDRYTEPNSTTAGWLRKRHYAKSDSHKLSKDLLSLLSTSSAKICWAATPHTIYIYTAQGLSVEEAESGSTTGMYTTLTQRRRFWVELHGRQIQDTGPQSRRCWLGLTCWLTCWLTCSLAELIGFLMLVGWWAFEPPIQRSPTM